MHQLENRHYNICGEDLITELKLFEELTGYDTKIWCNEINDRIKN